MGADTALYFMGQMLWTVMIVGAPILLTTLAVGLLISVFQVTTQIQEITLSYVPKILATGVLLGLLGPWILRQIASFATSLYSAIPSLTG